MAEPARPVLALTDRVRTLLETAPLIVLAA
jgi:hypothetical protein